MTNVGVMVSGGGTNLQVLIDRVADGYLDRCRLSAVISSRPGAYALVRAQEAGIPCECVEKKAFPTIDEYDKRLIEVFEEHDADLIVMAGYKSLVGMDFIERYRNRIINVHPSLIPAFSGKGFYGLAPHQKALEYGVKVTGATVHFVEYETDTGPIIMQKVVDIRDDDTPESLQKRVMEKAEQVLLPEAVKLWSEGRLAVEGRRVTVLKGKKPE